MHIYIETLSYDIVLSMIMFLCVQKPFNVNVNDNIHINTNITMPDSCGPGTPLYCGACIPAIWPNETSYSYCRACTRAVNVTVHIYTNYMNTNTTYALKPCGPGTPLHCGACTLAICTVKWNAVCTYYWPSWSCCIFMTFVVRTIFMTFVVRKFLSIYLCTLSNQCIIHIHIIQILYSFILWWRPRGDVHLLILLLMLSLLFVIAPVFYHFTAIFLLGRSGFGPSFIFSICSDFYIICFLLYSCFFCLFCISDIHNSGSLNVELGLVSNEAFIYRENDYFCVCLSVFWLYLSYLSFEEKGECGVFTKFLDLSFYFRQSLPCTSSDHYMI